MITKPDWKNCPDGAEVFYPETEDRWAAYVRNEDTPNAEIYYISSDNPNREWRPMRAEARRNRPHKDGIKRPLGYSYKQPGLDWSTAPADAQFFIPDNEIFHPSWMKKVAGQWWSCKLGDKQWHIDHGNEAEEFFDTMIPRPKTQPEVSESPKPELLSWLPI